MASHDRDREELASFLLRLRGDAQQPAKMLLQAVEAIPRRLFLPDEAGDVYADQAFPIPCGETAGSVRNAVRLLDALEVQPDSRILEIGTGSGYVTALLAKLGARVTSLERYRTLVTAAGERFKQLGITNVSLVLEDGRGGYDQNAPYDRILLHGALAEVPRGFLDQMAINARLVGAFGPALAEQRLVRHLKVGSRFEAEDLGSVRLQVLQRGIAAVL